MGCDDCSGEMDCDYVTRGWVQLDDGKIIRCRPGCDKCDKADPSNCLVASD